MGIFNRANKNVNRVEQAGSGPDSGRWGQLGAEVPFAGNRVNAAPETPAQPVANESQQAKIVAALLSGDARQVERDDITVHLERRQAYLERVARGEITLADQRNLLAQIASPREKYGAQVVMSGVVYDSQTGAPKPVPGIGGDKHLRRILAMASGRGPENYEAVGPEDLEAAWNRYPLPGDFEQEGEAFLQMIRRGNSPAKYQEYQQAMAQFKRAVYGKRQEYWEQMKLLNQEAELMGGTGVEASRTEQARDYEVLAERVGVYGVSRAQVKQGVQRGERMMDDGTSQDSALVLPERGMFGVFDGVGGMRDGRLASQTAAEAVAQNSGREIKSEQDLCEMLDQASAAINNIAGAQGASTGTLVKLQQTEMRRQLLWASVGDSRVYVVDKNGRAVQLSRDEGFENKITNALGGPGPAQRARQAGRYTLQDGDKVVLCSDGITGDKGAELMGETELGVIVQRAQTAGQAAQALVDGARKTDDRTAIVVEI